MTETDEGDENAVVFWGPVMLMAPNAFGTSRSEALKGEGNERRGFR